MFLYKPVTVALEIVIILSFLMIVSSTVVSVNGGQVTICGAVTQTQLDITVNYTSNVKWLAIIFSPDQVNADLHLLQVDETNAANPVRVRDCHLDQQSAIIIDDVNNIQPSITGLQGDISNGLKVAYNRDLFTGDGNDLRLYPNEVIQICFMSSLQEFVGGGKQTGNQKVCTYFSLHQQLGYFQDRLMGRYASTGLIGGSNLTLYATQSTQGYSTAPWLFVSVVHKQQGLNPFNGKWLGITYKNSLSQTDLTTIQYSTLSFTLQVHVRDMYITNSTYAKPDSQYTTQQGGNDVVKIAGGLNSVRYMMSSYKRKFATGDINRDIVIDSGTNVFCVILGDGLAYNNFVQVQKLCLTFDLQMPYTSNFRVVQSSSGNGTTENRKPNNTVTVKMWEDGIRIGLGILISAILIVF